MNQNVFHSNRHESRDDCDDRRWSALDSHSRHPFACDFDEVRVEQEAAQVASEVQISEELIFIKDSCEVKVTTVDTKTAHSLQQALQTTIAVIISISINDSDRAARVTQELLQSSRIKQVTRQKTIIENSRDIHVATADNQVAQINQQITLLLNLALTLISQLGID